MGYWKFSVKTRHVILKPERKTIPHRIPGKYRLIRCNLPWLSKLLGHHADGCLYFLGTLCPSAIIATGLAIHGGSVDRHTDEIKNWCIGTK